MYSLLNLMQDVTAYLGVCERHLLGAMGQVKLFGGPDHLEFLYRSLQGLVHCCDVIMAVAPFK